MFEASEGGCLLYVRAAPQSRKLGLGGAVIAPDGRQWLKIHIKEAPEDGKANEALCKWLAKTLRISASACCVVKGEKSRQKIIAIGGITPEALKQRLKLNT